MIPILTMLLMRVTGTASGTIPFIYKTTDNFTNLTLYSSCPADVDTGIPDEDFTRGQALVRFRN